jgi:DNA-binding beta-propeller fold protein YncE
MPRTFDCPKCGAPVSYERDVVGANLTAQCRYCNSALTVPDELHGRPAQIINIHVGSGDAGKSLTKWILLVVLVPVVALVIGAIAIGGFVVPSFRSSNSALPVVNPVRGRTATKKSEPGFASEVLKFGSDGIGPGMFKDARSIAVDRGGNIYVGEYSGGRVQVFDSTGKFKTQWSVDPKMPLRALAADRKGVVYVVQKGVISRHDGETGNPLGQLRYADGDGFDDVGVAADGGLVAAWYRNRDDIIRFAPSGEVTRTIRAAISSTSGDSELNTRVAVDGLGNIYALGTFNNAVFKFSPDGKFLTRFGSDGDQPGQFRAPSAIAVDGKGRLYVSDFKGVQVFDSNGRYLAVFNPGGTASGMVFNDKGELFVAARNHVVKLAINEP